MKIYSWGWVGQAETGWRNLWPNYVALLSSSTTSTATYCWGWGSLRIAFAFGFGSNDGAKLKINKTTGNRYPHRCVFFFFCKEVVVHAGVEPKTTAVAKLTLNDTNEDENDTNEDENETHEE